MLWDNAVKLLKQHASAHGERPGGVTWGLIEDSFVSFVRTARSVVDSRVYAQDFRARKVGEQEAYEHQPGEQQPPRHWFGMSFKTLNKAIAWASLIQRQEFVGNNVLIVLVSLQGRFLTPTANVSLMGGRHVSTDPLLVQLARAYARHEDQDPDPLLDYLQDQPLASSFQEAIQKALESRSAQCQDCGKVVAPDQLYRGPCPYQADLYEREVSIQVCFDCYHERRMDI